MLNVSRENTICEYRHFFRKIFDEPKPLAKLYRTDKTGYLYDAGTNKMLACENSEFKLLEKLITMNVDQAIDSILQEINKPQFIDASFKIKRAIEKENILLTKRPFRFGLSAHFHGFKEMINTSLGILQLEATEKCNLRCRYCVYNPSYPEKRNHSNREMSISVAYKAIDYLFKHCKDKHKASVTFYGGEPLLRFDFIKKCVNYANHVLGQKDLLFSMTTNGTLLTREMADFLFRNKFSLTFSIDGPEDIHDDYRKDIKGRGSFKRAIAGLENAVDVFGKYSQERILLSMVYAPPFSEEKLGRIAEIWDKMPSLFAGMHPMISYPQRGTIPNNKYLGKKILEDKDLFTWASEIYDKDYFVIKKLNPIVKSVIEKPMAKLYKRPIYSKPLNKYHLNGCCIPGTRKIFVSTSGDFHICERIPYTAPKIGNVFSGIDIDTIKKTYIDEYSTRSILYCSACWAIQLCGVCYAHSFNNGRFNIGAKNEYCAAERFFLEKQLILYSSLLEENQNGLDHLSKMVLE